MSDIPPLSEQAKNLKLGTYKHFKGGLYKIVCVARNSEACEQEVVVYQSIEKEYIWVRPLEMFLDNVDRDGYKGPRFTFVE